MIKLLSNTIQYQYLKVCRWKKNKQNKKKQKK